METSATSDSELLAAWVEHRRESAFHALVSRYATLVHMAAKRTCGDDSLAADASQLVFILLARKAKSLTTHSTLAGWLHVTAVLKTRDLMDKARRESRKRRHLGATMDAPAHSQSNDVWKEMQPVLDDALAALSEKDREALLLRFYRSLTIREIAATLGIATDAAQKRIDRATARLRGKLARRGCQAGGSLGTAMLAGFAADAQAAALPVSLLASKAVAAGAASSGMLSITSAVLTVSAMKTISVLVLVSACFWIAGQFHSIARLEQQNALLANHLAAGPDLASAVAKRPAAKKSALDRRPINWSAVAAELRNSRSPGSGWGYLSSSARVEQGLRSMDREELINALEEIGERDLSREDRQVLEVLLIPCLTQKDPEYVVKKFLHRLHEENCRYTLTGALGQWAKSDPEKAVAWFEEQVAAGKFESKGVVNNLNLLIPFRSALVAAFLSTDAAAADRQLAAVPEAVRMQVIQSFLGAAGGEVKAADHVAWANLLRQQLPEADRLEAITWPVSDLGESGTIEYSALGNYFSEIDATSAEREACIVRVAEECRFPRKAGGYFGTTTGDLDAFRAWIGGHAPELVDQATVKALSGLSNQSGFNYPEWAAFALRCHEAGGSDEVLIPLLEAHNVSKNIELARNLAARLTDEKRRAEFLKTVDRMHPEP